MTLRINLALRNLLANAFGGAFDSGTLIIYTGAQPANPSDAPTGTVLATIALPADAFATTTTGVIAKSGTWQDLLADNTGDAGWFRMTGTGGTPNICDGSVGVTGSGAQLEINNISLVVNKPIVITAFNVTQPAQ